MYYPLIFMGYKIKIIHTKIGVEMKVKAGAVAVEMVVKVVKYNIVC